MVMSRSLKVSPHYIKQVKVAVKRHGFARQTDLAKDLQLSRSTVSNFLNGRPVDFLNFYEICHRLDLDLDELREREDPDEVNPDVEPEQVETEAFNYIERPPIESRCYETILQPGSLLRIKAPKRMGKTWLIDRILDRAAEENYRTVRLRLLLADRAVLNSLDEFLRWFCVVICRQLKLLPQIAEYWEYGLGSNYNCTVYFEEYLLSQIDCPLVLALDDVDRIFSYDNIAGDFFGLLRAWHEEAKSRPIWKKLRLVVAHSTEVYIPLNINRSPFNVGVPIELPEFTPEQVQDLAKRQGLNWEAVGAQGFAPLLEMVGGHLYLVQRAIYYLSRQEITLQELLQTAHTESGIYSGHLRGHLSNLLEHPELATAMKEVVNATTTVQLEPMQAFKLQSLGLVRLEGNDAKPWCNLYARYFCTHL
jgi:transcriptional regulator with XRE-family HTH domain